MHITFLYGSETGTAQEVAENLAYAALRYNATCHVAPADNLPVQLWSRNSPLVIVCSTTGQGEPPETILQTWDILRSQDAPDLEGLQYAVFGLGDSSYLKFNIMAKMLHNRLQQLGGTPLLMRGLGDDEDAGGYAEELNKWAPKLWAALGVSSATRKVSDAPVAMKYKVSLCREAGAIPRVEYDRRTVPCKVLLNQRLTSVDHFQSVHHVEFESPSSFNLGLMSAIGVWPRNPPELVARMVRACKLVPEDVVTVSLDNGHGLSTVDSFSHHFVEREITVDQLLSCFFDLSAAASRTFLRALATVAADVEEAERLLELAADDHLFEYTDYCYREKRNCVEVIEDFTSCTVSLDLVTSFLKPLRPRYFSVSSSPTADSSIFSLTVAKLEFVTPMKRKREGICSSQLCAARIGEIFDCSVKIPSVEVDFSKRPLLLIGPGTGIAPLRAIVRELSASNRIVLYRGCRFHEKDNLYEVEWLQVEARCPTFRQHLAVSRENNSRRYVHHWMVTDENAREIANLLREGGMIVVCGNSKQMPKDVERALESIAEVFLPDLGSNFLKLLKKDGRFIMDTWS